MPKREKSPEIAEDDKYFTVYKPYPLNANWEVEEDYIACSRWIACCIGVEPLHALYHKPTARGMILLEIDKKYPHNGHLLGEHRWDEFLKKPSEEEEGRITQIFHSFYSKGRDAQKDGWKRIHVEAAWFKDILNFKKLINDPYPETHWCPLPCEDKTNKSFCRPLPVKVQLPLVHSNPQSLLPVVGSTPWVSAKAAPSPNASLVVKDNWERARTSVIIPAEIPEGSAWNKPIMQNNSPGASTPHPVPNAWNNPVSSPTSSSHCPPGLGSRTQSAPATFTHHKSKNYSTPPGVSRNVSSSSGHDQTSSGTGASEPVLTDRPFEEFFKDKGAISFSDDEDDDDAFPKITAKDGRPPWEKKIPEVDPIADLWARNSGANGQSENLWNEKEIGAPKKPTVPLCPDHGPVCKKGLCPWRSARVKEEERQKKEGGGNGSGSGSGSSWRSGDGGDGGKKRGGGGGNGPKSPGGQKGDGTVTRGRKRGGRQ